jgi:plastocyanin
MGMTDAAASFTVQAVGMTFQPATITVPPGSTVEWTAISLSHTVTSGSGSTAAGAGSMFDLPLAQGHTVGFHFTTPGTFPYFCRVHEAFNMRGTVVVSAGR